MRTANAVRYEFASQRAEVYRVFTLLGSFDDARVKKERAAIAARFAEVGGRLKDVQLADGDEDDRLAARAGAAIAQYAKKADDAIDMGSGDIKLAIAAMMSADEAYKASVEAVNADAACAEQVALRSPHSSTAIRNGANFSSACSTCFHRKISLWIM